MGQKTNPYGFRLVYNKPWHSRWYADHGYADLLHEDLLLRKYLRKRLAQAGVDVGPGVCEQPLGFGVWPS